MSLISQTHQSGLILVAAQRYLGAPYLRHDGWSDAREYHAKRVEERGSGFCCSGLVIAVAHACSIALPKQGLDARGLFDRLPAVSVPNIGDLVFVSSKGVGICHVGFVAEEGILHASKTSASVCLSSFEEFFTQYPVIVPYSHVRHPLNPVGYRRLANT